jgi:hypothetical protein
MPKKTDIETAQLNNHLAETAMLVKLTRKKFNHNKCDKDLSREQADRLNVKMKNAVRVMKSLVSKEFVQPYTRIINNAGTYYYGCTLPWTDKGWRMLPATMFDEFSEKFRSFSTRLDAAVNSAGDKLEAEIEKMSRQLGKAFNRDDYPTVEEFKSGMILKVDFQAITAGDDFRVKISETQRQAIIDEINDRNRERVVKANEFLWNRLHDVVSKMADTLKEEDKIFRNSLVANVAELCDLLPRLNINDDQALNDRAKAVKDLLGDYDPQELREQPEVRKEAAKEAAAQASDIMNDMAGVF